jgi:hypothetical protein
MSEQLVQIPEAIIDSLVEAGDVVRVDNGWTAGKNFFPSGLIRHLDRVKYEGKWYKSAVNHVYRKFTFANGMQIICESHFKGGVQINSYTKLLRAIRAGKVTRVYEKQVELSLEDMAELWNRYLMFEGAGYDKKLILLYYIWNRTGRAFDKLLSRNRKSKYTCNEIFYTVGRDIDPLCKEATIKDTPEKLIFKVVGKPSILVPAAEFDYDRELNDKALWVDYE